MEVSVHDNHYTFTDTYEHPEGGDRGGFAQDIHEFTLKEGLVTHEQTGCCPGEPEDYGLDPTDNELRTKEDALDFVQSQTRALQRRLDELAKLEAALQANTYQDDTDYGDEEEDEDEDDYDDEELDEDDED